MGSSPHHQVGCGCRQWIDWTHGNVVVGGWHSHGGYLSQGTRWNGSLSPVRTDFHATVSGGAAMDDNGTVAMAFMGTGVYLFQHGRSVVTSYRGSCHGLDICILCSWSNYVVDFEGINLLQSDGAGQMLDSRIRLDG